MVTVCNNVSYSADKVGNLRHQLTIKVRDSALGICKDHLADPWCQISKNKKVYIRGREYFFSTRGHLRTPAFDVKARVVWDGPEDEQRGSGRVEQTLSKRQATRD